MSITDPIANLLTIINNGNKVKKEYVDVHSSKIKVELVRILKENGYVSNYKIIRDNKQNVIHILLAYKDGTSVIKKLHRISKPSLRIYKKHEEIKRVLNGYGMAIVSTSKGVMTDKQAREQKIGGELICEVW
ncbi:MAG: 30S ribosomal protein S8 [bacterium]|nr:30S ribosomal protein S8 [bacterium]